MPSLGDAIAETTGWTPPASSGALLAAPPARTAIEYPRPSAITDWVENGQVVAGHEANGLALPDRVIESMNQAGPPQYVVIGEVRYSDGRWFLDFAVSDRWVKYRTAETACPECGGIDGSHYPVTFTDPRTIRPITTRCPNDPDKRPIAMQPRQRR